MIGIEFIEGYHTLASLSISASVETGQLAVLGFYGLVFLGVCLQFLRYAVIIPLCLKLGLVQREVLMQCTACGTHYGIPVTEVAHEDPSPCCETTMDPPPDDCENGELYEAWAGEQ